jgi:methyl-accepting chemotaxis protein
MNSPQPQSSTQTGEVEEDAAGALPTPATVIAPRSRHLQVRLKNSIGSKLFLYVISGALVSLSGVSYFLYQALRGQAETEIQSRLASKAEVVESKLLRAEQSVIGLASTISSLNDQNINDLEAYKNLAFDFFRNRPELTMGVGFGQAANKIVSERQWFYPYFYLDQKVSGQLGQVLPAPNEGTRYTELWADDKYPEQDYYKQMAESQRPQWYEPYQWHGITITTHARPIFNEQNDFLGLATLDINVTAISDLINDTVIDGQGKFAILSDQGTVLAYPLQPELAKNLATYADIPSLKAAWPQIGQNQSGLVLVEGDFWAYERIEGTNWLMLAKVPKSVVNNKVLLITLGSALAAGGLLALVVLLFVRQLNRRLQPLLDECNRLAESDMQRAMRLGIKSESLSGLAWDSHLAEADELEIVTRSFRQVTAQLQDSFAVLEETNETLEQRVEERTNELKQAKDTSEADRQTLQRRALELLREVDPISKGDLTIRAKVTPDEIGTLADSYNATVASLRKIVLQVQSTASQVTETTGHNSEYVQALSVEATQQAAEITDALERIKQLAEVVRLVAANAEQAEAIVQQTAQTVQEGDQAMDRTVDGIRAIRATVAETAKKVKHLGESSQKISTVVELISAFASQTNMLALNASIEASRAGESGRGFAIVASEVRALAQRSAEATEEIRKLVSGIQAETNEVVVAMEAGTEQVVIGTQLVDETRQSLNKITAASAKISHLVEDIAQATVVQSEATETVSQTMQDVATIAQKTSAEASQVADSFQQLQEVAQTLQASVGRFKVN